MSEALKKVGPSLYELARDGHMRVPGLIVASEALLSALEAEGKPLDQVRNVAALPGIVGYSIAMPDIHWGYGFPIGGVAAMDVETGVISPGGVGYDINCGVRLALVPEKFSSLTEKSKEDVLSAIFEFVPSGVGRGHKGKKLKHADYARALTRGSAWSVEQGYGFAQDLEHTESLGVIEGADIEHVTDHAMERGRHQMGSIGSGNHFVEVGEIEKILLPTIADAWGMEEGQIYVMIHTGSRGLGHQVCQDTLNTFIKKGFAEGLPDRQLVAAPIGSPQGQNYFAAMAAAANFAFNNRQQVLHYVREAFERVLNIPAEKMTLLYDVCHNIAKFETHVINGVSKKVCVHRKGATRAFGPGAQELSPLFQKTGQPVIVPGDMGRCSYLMVGLGNPLTWSSCCHGAGRAMSRTQSSKLWRDKDPIHYMEDQGVKVMATSRRTITEEMPQAYKDVTLVVESAQEAGLANTVAKLKPHLVIKG